MKRLIAWLRAWRHPMRGVGTPVSCFAFGCDPRPAESLRFRCRRCHDVCPAPHEMRGVLVLPSHDLRPEDIPPSAFAAVDDESLDNSKDSR